MIEVKNSTLFDPAFTKSFKELMAFSGFTPEQKISLVKMRKDFVSTLEKVKSESSKAGFKEMFTSLTSYHFKKIPLTNDLSNYLTAEDMFNLESILEEENV